MFIVLSLLTSQAFSAVDSYTLGKELSEISRFQHQNGGFFDNGRDSNGLDTMRAVWLSGIFGLFNHFDARSCFRWFSTLRNRDGGCGFAPGMKSSISATYNFVQIAALVSPETIDAMSIIDFLKSRYDSSTGLFRESQDSEPNVEATFYAYSFLAGFTDADLSWLNTFAIRNYISDHLVDGHFEFEGVDSFAAQLYAGSIAKAISLTVPYHRISEYISAQLLSGIKSTEMSLEQAAIAARALQTLGDQPVPSAVAQWIKLTPLLSDLFHATQLLLSTGEISKFFEVKVLAINHEGATIDIEKEGATIQQIIRPAVQIVALQRFVNPILNVNITLGIADEAPFTEHVQMDFNTGLYSTQRLSQISKLGQLNIEVVAWLATQISSPLVITKAVQSHVSLPIEVSCEAWVQANEVIPQGGEIGSGSNLRVLIDGKFEEGFEIESTTESTFAVYDASGALLAYNTAPFKTQKEYNWQMPQLVLPSGAIKVVVEIGDSVNGIHTRKEFVYSIKANMAGSSVEYSKNLKLSDLLKVKMVPGLFINGEIVPFTNTKLFEGELKDAAGEAFFPQPIAESHRYAMLVKCGGQVVKSVEGEVHAEEGKLVVEFESSVEENLDFATGFNVDFVFLGEDGQSIPLRVENDVFINVASKIVAEGGQELLKGGNTEYGATISGTLKLKDLETGRYLSSGRAYPVAVLRTAQKKVLVESRAFVDEEFLCKFNIEIGAAIPSGQAFLSIMIRKGAELVAVVDSEGNPFQSTLNVKGEIEITANVLQSGPEFVVIDYSVISAGKKLKGGAFEAHIISHDGQLISTIPLSQMSDASRLTWSTSTLSGEYTVDLHRAGAGNEKSLVSTKLALQNKIVSFAHRLPIEGIAIATSFALFSWAIGLRRRIRPTKLQ